MPVSLERRSAPSLLALLLLAPALARAEGPPVLPQMAGGATADDEDEAMGARLQEALRSHGGDVFGCYDRAQREERRALAGELLVRLWVAPGGSVSRVDMLKDEVGSSSLTGCLTGAMRGWQVPSLAGADVRQVVFPLVFKPEGGSAADAAATSVPRFVVPLADGKPGPIGRGSVEARVLIDPLTVASPRATLTHLTLRPSARLAPHAHPGVVELLYVVKGLARVRGSHKGAAQSAAAGDLIVVPPGGLHSVEAAPLAPLTLLQLFAPGGPEHAYRDPTDRSGTQPAAPSGRNAGKPTDPPVVVRAADLRSYPIAGGKGSALLFLDALPVGEAAVERLEAEAGAKIPLHQHDASDELVFVLAGRGRMEIRGQRLAIGPHDAVHIPAGVGHSLDVSEKLVAIQCYAPGGPEQRFKQPPPANPKPGSVPGGMRP